MRVAKIDSGQAWLIEIGSDRILVNPLDLDPAMLATGKWSMGNEQAKAAALPKIHLVLISSDRAEHLAATTLRPLGPDIPIYTTPRAAQRLRDAGFRRVVSFANKPLLKSRNTHVAAFPIDAVGGKETAAFFVKETERKATAFVVPFGARNYPVPAKEAPIDFFLAPTTDVRRLGRTIAPASTLAVEAAKVLKPSAFAPIGQSASLPWLARAVAADEFVKRGFALAKLNTSILTPVPGKAIEIYRLSA